MKIIRSSVLGFCMGVRRAIDMALAEADVSAKTPDRAVYTLGSLIHNSEVLNDLKNHGINELSENCTNLENCSVIIRAHGVDPNSEKKLRSRGAHVIDATCPKVKASQLKVKELAEEGFKIFIAGDAHHAEIEGLIGYAGDAVSAVVSNAEQARAAAKTLCKTDKTVKTALAAQTTISEEEYKIIGEEIKKYFPDLKIVQSICGATQERQKALIRLQLLEEVEAVIIAGSKESANTRRLFAIAKESGKACILAENSSEVPDNFLLFKVVGLSAGASTPDSVIDDIEQKLTKNSI